MKHDQVDLRQLLTREEFKRVVFARAGGRCVFCEAPAVDPHHILERKLFEDGGYYAGNGAAVCDVHHWHAEMTLLTVEAVREAARIDTPVLPPGFLPGVLYDKWGNRIWPSGARSLGPLGDDDGMRRALGRGRALYLLRPADYTE